MATYFESFFLCICFIHFGNGFTLFERLGHSLARLFPLEKRSLSETVVSMARCIPTHHFTVLMRQQEYFLKKIFFSLQQSYKIV